MREQSMSDIATAQPFAIEKFLFYIKQGNTHINFNTSTNHKQKIDNLPYISPIIRTRFLTQFKIIKQSENRI